MDDLDPIDTKPPYFSALRPELPAGLPGGPSIFDYSPKIRIHFWIRKWPAKRRNAMSPPSAFSPAALTYPPAAFYFIDRGPFGLGPLGCGFLFVSFATALSAGRTFSSPGHC